MDKSYNDNIRPLLDLADRLTPLLKGTTIKIPRIASCGMQSHGKSSTLESITHISLPKGDGTITICPIKISLRNAKDEEFARIKFEMDKEEKYEKIKLEEISDKIMDYQNYVKEENNVKENEVKLFDKVIQVEVNRKNAPNLTLYDMPGLNFKKEIRKKSEEINEKFLKEKETTVLLVISGSEEVTNSYATEWMKKIPEYNKRFNAIITKADFLKNKSIGVYLDQINSLNLINPPSLLINKFGDYEKLSYEEMQEEELKLINQIPNIDKYPKVNKGIQALIEQLIKIQKEDLYITFADIASKVRREIDKNEKTLKSLPSQCESQEKFFDILEECIKKFKEKINLKKETLKCKEDGTPEVNLLKYEIQLIFRKHIKNVKLKINELFTLPFCKQVTNNIIQSNSDNISILEDIIPFSNLLKPKIKEILSDFEPTIGEIFDYMVNNIKPIINESFGKFEPLASRVRRLYSIYSLEQKNKMLNFYQEIYFIENENISTFNNNELINKVNTINKHINFILFGKNKSINISNISLNCSSLEKVIPQNLRTELDNQVIETRKDIITENVDNPTINEKEENNEKKKEDELNEENNEEKEEDEINEEKKKKKKKKKKKIINDDEENKVFQTINDLTSEVLNNKNFGDVVKEKYKKYAELIKSLITINYNYEKEKNTRRYDNDEYAGRIKIAYRPQDIGTFYERLINEEFLKLNEDAENEFIPGFQYINKKKLIEFQKFITKGDVQIKTANIITKMVSYLEIMLNRVLDMIFLSIQKYLYDRLTDDKMICHIRNGIHLLSFEKCKKLVEIKPELVEKRNEVINNIKNLKKALKEIDQLKTKNNIFLEDDIEEDDEEDKKEIKNK